jgi:hypothetical protein
MSAATRFTTKMLQARCAALGFWPGPIDGDMGRRTRDAMAAAERSQEARGRPFIHPSGLTRIHWHWTGGAYQPNAIDCAHYHFIVDGDANVIACHDPVKHLSHTLNANTGAIGVAVAAMGKAVERPFSRGPYPLLSRQLAALTALSARLCADYDIPVSRWSTMSHSEVQPTLGIRQRMKWDINWLPDLAGPSDPHTVNDRIRKMVARDLRAIVH